jgi:hypothetical protein
MAIVAVLPDQGGEGIPEFLCTVAHHVEERVRQAGAEVLFMTVRPALNSKPDSQFSESWRKSAAT